MPSTSVTKHVVRALGVAALAAGALLGASAAASAAPGDAPQSGDDRATVVAGNAVTCDQAGLSGSIIKVTNSVDASNTYIDVTAVPDGVTVTGVVVKGGPAYNVYRPDHLGALPWNDLHSPLVPSGKPAQISHWYVCAEGSPATTPSSPTQPTSQPTSQPATMPTDTSSPAGAGGTGTSPSTPAAPQASPAETGLASTGFGNAWLVPLGAVLLVGGAALLFLVRRRTARD